VNGGGIHELIREKYGSIMGFYESTCVELGVSVSTLKRFIGSRRPSQKTLARKILTLLGRDASEYDRYFLNEDKKCARVVTANNGDMLEALILKVEELQQKIDNLSAMISMYHRWDAGRK
jgi:hypothetical protein